MQPGDMVRIRVPNWRKVAGEWVSEPTEHDVTLTGLGEGYIEFTGMGYRYPMTVSARQLVERI